VIVDLSFIEVSRSILCSSDWLSYQRCRSGRGYADESALDAHFHP
jgi:hypothetical protein